MKIEGPATRLTIYLGESDTGQHGPLYHQIVQQAREAGLAGATVLRGIEGFGASSRLHTARILSLSEDMPIVIVIVDRTDRIDSFMPVLDRLITEGLVVREQVDIMLYRGRPADAARSKEQA